MPIASTCPRCDSPVTLPDAQPAAWMQCPLCEAQFALREALDCLPPSLVVLDAGPVMAAVPGAAGAARAEGSLADVPMVEFPGQEDALAHFAAEEGDAGTTSIGGGLDSQRFPLAEESPDDDGAILGNFAGADSDAHGSAGPGSSTRFNFGLGDEDGGSIGYEPRASTGPNMLIEFVKIVAGGVVGLALAYYILLWLNHDPLQLAHKLPPWFVPSSFGK